MPRNIAPVQISLPGGMAENRLPFVIVTPGTSIQAAIDVVSPLGAFPGKHIWIWPGTFTLFAPLTVPAGAEIYIWGCGYDTIIEMDVGGGGPDPMFELAAGVTEFQLHDLTIEQRTFPTNIVETLGACTHMYFDNILSNPIDGPVNGTNFIAQAAAANITNCEIEHCDIDGVLDLRGVTGRLHDNTLDAVNAGHNFQNDATIYSARNIWLGGVGGVGATVVVGAANALFHDEGSHYTGDVALVIAGGEVSLRGCHMFAGTGNTISITGGQVSLEGCEVDNNAAETISHTGGTLRLSDCTVINTTRTCIHSDAPNAVRLGVHNCDIIATAAFWGINVQNGQAEIVGNDFTQCGISVDVVATISANIIDSDVVAESIRVRANDVTITGNKIITCGHAGAIAIELDVNDDCVVVGNQLQGYTVNENVGAVGNIIASNRVGV